LVCDERFFAGELAAVGYEDVFSGLVAALGGKVFDFADERLAVEDFAEDDVFSV